MVKQNFAVARIITVATFRITRGRTRKPGDQGFEGDYCVFGLVSNVLKTQMFGVTGSLRYLFYSTVQREMNQSTD